MEQITDDARARPKGHRFQQRRKHIMFPLFLLLHHQTENQITQKYNCHHRQQGQMPLKECKKRKKKTAKDYAIEFFIKVGITALAVAALLIFVVGIHVNHGNSAYPMIKDGDLVITYKLDKGQNGVEIAYTFNGKVKFGRIVAKEGDTVDITDQGLLVNGYGILEEVVYPTTSSGAAISFPYIVPKGTVFVLNDYRSDAGDSRTYGAIPLSDVEGEVVLILRRLGI